MNRNMRPFVSIACSLLLATGTFLGGCSKAPTKESGPVYGPEDVAERKARIRVLLEQLDETGDAKLVKIVRDGLDFVDSMDKADERLSELGYRDLERKALQAECEYYDNLIKLLEMAVDPGRVPTTETSPTTDLPQAGQ